MDLEKFCKAPSFLNLQSEELVLLLFPATFMMQIYSHW